MPTKAGSSVSAELVVAALLNYSSTSAKVEFSVKYCRTAAVTFDTFVADDFGAINRRD